MFESGLADIAAHPGVDLARVSKLLDGMWHASLTRNGIAGMYEKKRRERRDVMSAMMTSTSTVTIVKPIWCYRCQHM